MIVAVDFDGTLHDGKFPYIGKPKMDVINIVKKLKNEGNEIVLWTCRHGAYLDIALKWCNEMGLVFDAINDDTQEMKDVWADNRSKKISADLYIDDKALTPDDFVKAFS